MEFPEHESKNKAFCERVRALHDEFFGDTNLEGSPFVLGAVVVLIEAEHVDSEYSTIMSRDCSIALAAGLCATGLAYYTE
jgi:hypothetical protein